MTNERSKICSFGHYSYVGVVAKWPNGKMTKHGSKICSFGHYSYVGVMAKWPYCKTAKKSGNGQNISVSLSLSFFLFSVLSSSVSILSNIYYPVFKPYASLFHHCINENLRSTSGKDQMLIYYIEFVLSDY